MDSIDVERQGKTWTVFDDLMQDGTTVPDTWPDDEVREVAEQKRREAAWYDAVLKARACA